MWVLGTVREVEVTGIDRRQTVFIYQVAAELTLARAPGPTCATGSMAGGEMGRNRNVPNLESFAVMQLMHIMDRGNTMSALILRISVPRLSRSQHRSTPRTCHHTRSAQPLKFGDPSRMIVVDVGVENQFDVFDPEAQ